MTKTDNKGFLSRASQHPFWSGLAVAAIAGITGLLFDSTRTWLKAGGIVVWNALVSIAHWLVSSTPVWNWLIVAMALAVVAVAFVGIRAALESGGEQQPKLTDYRSDDFDGMRWYWRLGSDGFVYGLHACCPDCLMQLTLKQEYYGATSLHCQSCNRDLRQIETDPAEYERRITLFIQKKLRNGEWQDVVRGSTAAKS